MPRGVSRKLMLPWASDELRFGTSRALLSVSGTTVRLALAEDPAGAGNGAEPPANGRARLRPPPEPSANHAVAGGDSRCRRVNTLCDVSLSSVGAPRPGGGCCRRSRDRAMRIGRERPRLPVDTGAQEGRSRPPQMSMLASKCKACRSTASCA
jgi:hypothetical protein